MPAPTGAFSNLLVPGFRKTFFTHLKDRKKEYEQLFYMTTSKRAYEEHLEGTMFGSMPKKPEGTSIVYQDPIQGGVKRFTHVTYAMGFRVTEEMMEDDLYGVVGNKNSRALKRSAMNAREVAAFNIFNLSFTTEYGFPKNGSNEALVSTSHTLIGGGTASNRPSTDVDISYAALEAAVLNFNTLVDERNLPIDIMPETLLFHPTDLFLVSELLESEYRPFTANNEINPLKSRFKPVWSRYLSDPDAWWLVGEKSEEGLIGFIRRELRFQNGDDFDSGDAKYKASQRFSFGCSEWRYLYGSSGA